MHYLASFFYLSSRGSLETIGSRFRCRKQKKKKKELKPMRGSNLVRAEERTLIEVDMGALRVVLVILVAEFPHMTVPQQV